MPGQIKSGCARADAVRKRLQRKVAERQAGCNASALQFLQPRQQPRQRWSEEEWLAFKSKIEARQRALPLAKLPANAVALESPQRAMALLPPHLQKQRELMEHGLLPEWKFRASVKVAMWEQARGTDKMALLTIQIAVNEGRFRLFDNLVGVHTLACLSREFCRWVRPLLIQIVKVLIVEPPVGIFASTALHCESLPDALFVAQHANTASSCLQRCK